MRRGWASQFILSSKSKIGSEIHCCLNIPCSLSTDDFLEQHKNTKRKNIQKSRDCWAIIFSTKMKLIFFVRLCLDLSDLCLQIDLASTVSISADQKRNVWRSLDPSQETESVLAKAEAQKINMGCVSEGDPQIQKVKANISNFAQGFNKTQKLSLPKIGRT